MSFEFLSLDNIQELARQYGYWTVFMGISLENTGIPIPGETMTIVGGFLAGSGELNYWLVLASAISGAVIGDNFGYWIGRIGGWQFLLRLGKFFGIQENQLEDNKKKFRENAARAVFWGRFVTLLRIFAGPLAGITQMPYQQFLLWNFSGAIVWAFTMVNLSFFLGRLVPLPQLVELIAKFGILALGLVIVWILFPIWRENRTRKLETQD
ncbi:MAG: DedA family protein [Prochloraceae cyanobacterium]